MAPKLTGIETPATSLELLYHISRELASALDLHTVLQRVLYLSTQNVGAISGSIIVLDDSGLPVESAFLLRGKAYDQSRLQLRLTFERGLAGWVARHRQPALLPDTSQDERWLRRPDDAPDQTGPKSVVASPILAHDQLVGVITLVHPAPLFFTQDHLALVQAIADQAGIAILNGRLYAESQRQARVMTAVAESAAVITASLDLDEVLSRILEQVSQALGVEAASLSLLDSQGRELEFRASTAQQGLVGKRVPLGQGVVGWVAAEGVGAVVDDVDQDPRFSPEVDRMLGFKTRAIACAPVRWQDQMIGVLEVINPLAGAFDPDALLVLTGIGSLAGTAIRHAQLFERLQAAHQRYRELFEDSINPILITDWTGSVLEANRQAEVMTGLDSPSLHSRNLSSLYVLDWEKLGANFKNISPGNTISFESVLQAQDSIEVPIRAYVHQVMIDGKSYLQWVLRDISERKNLDTLRDDLISMIYHDLRSPLANVVSSLDVLASMTPAANGPAYKSLLNIAVRSTERIQRLTNSLLDMNRLEAGQAIGNLQPNPPLDLVTDSVEAVSPIAQNKNIAITISVPADVPQVDVDADMIRRVLVNLVENAIKFTPPGGKIQVGAQREKQWIKFRVKDTGPGIPYPEQERIFEKFTRLRIKDGPRGLGLGLAFCRLAIIGHGGRIWVESEPGSGSSFIFTLPVAEGS